MFSWVCRLALKYHSVQTKSWPGERGHGGLFALPPAFDSGSGRGSSLELSPKFCSVRWPSPPLSQDAVSSWPSGSGNGNPLLCCWPPQVLQHSLGGRVGASMRSCTRLLLVMPFAFCSWRSGVRECGVLGEWGVLVTLERGWGVARAAPGKRRRSLLCRPNS